MNNSQEMVFSVPIAYSLEHAPAGYATQLIVQHTEHEFILHFFEVKPPLLLGSPSEQQEQLKRMDTLQAKGIASITVAAGRMPEFLQALQGNFEMWQHKYAQGKSDGSQ